MLHVRPALRHGNSIIRQQIIQILIKNVRSDPRDPISRSTSLRSISITSRYTNGIQREPSNSSGISCAPVQRNKNHPRLPPLTGTRLLTPYPYTHLIPSNSWLICRLPVLYESLVKINGLVTTSGEPALPGLPAAQRLASRKENSRRVTSLLP